MTAQELNAVRTIQKKIRNLECDIQELRLSVENLVPIVDGLPHAKTAISRVESLALKITASESELENLRGQIQGERTRLAELIMKETNKPVVQTLLVLRYVECLSFKETARRLRLTLRHAFRLHEKFFKCHIAAQKEE